MLKAFELVQIGFCFLLARKGPPDGELVFVSRGEARVSLEIGLCGYESLVTAMFSTVSKGVDVSFGKSNANWYCDAGVSF